MSAVIFFSLVAIIYAISRIYATLYDAKGKVKHSKNVLFVLAHPDDECMFFTPTIDAMKDKCNLYILVLCNGGYDGLGEERTLEMARAAKHMGFRGHKVIDDTRNKDGPVIWSADIVQEHIETHLNEKSSQGIDIKTIVTFDDGGVSHHPNHIACHYGVMKFYDEHVKSGGASIWQDMDVYTLETVPWYRTYIGFLDIFMSRKDQVNYYLPTPYTGMRVMYIHHTQFVWYRKLFLWFARYVYMNGLTHYPKQVELID